MHPYRTHSCGALRGTDVGQTVRLSGWVHRKRDHGNLLFVDLRDHFGITQCVVDSDNPHFAALEGLRVESVITVTGRVVARSPETVNAKLATGEIEVRVDDLTVQSRADLLPLQVNSEADSGEDIRLRYRFLDLRRDKIHRNILLRSAVIASLRRRMLDQGFTEFQTPILTASSPEGARDFLVPSRMHPGSVLCAAAGAAAVQAAADGGGLRSLFPDRAVLPRRGQPGRPQPGRVLSARFRDVLRHPGRRVRRDRAGAARRVRGIRRLGRGCSHRLGAAVPAHPL